jgi:hypothetical protein
MQEEVQALFLMPSTYKSWEKTDYQNEMDSNNYVYWLKKSAHYDFGTQFGPNYWQCILP